jgi:putative OmpL-like beta-barrel porin-2
MQKTVLSVSVAAALAIPGLALAQAAAPAVPTLDKVLDASGIAATGYIDMAYSHANRNIEGSNVSTRVFDSQNNSFVLHQVGLQLAKQPKEGFGGLVNVTLGKDAGVVHSTPANEATFDLTQGYLQYATGPLTVIGGKYTTMHGTEVIWSPNNANFSRSILFGAVPFTHTGVRATYAISDSVSVMAGVNNGWDQLVDQNKGKTLELGTTLTPIKPLSITASFMSGQEMSAPATPTIANVTSTGENGRRDSLNLVGSYTISDPLSVGLEYLRVTQKNAVIDAGGNEKKMTYDGLAGYVSYLVMPKLKTTLRVETFNDKDGYHFGVADTKYREFTLTLAYLAASSFELRGEVRTDRATNAVFNDGGAGSKTLMTYAIQGLYKF